MLVLDKFSKSPLLICEIDMWLYVNSEMFIVRTNDHFQRYERSKAIKIPANTKFSVYNVSMEPIACKWHQDFTPALTQLEDDLERTGKYVYTIFRGVSRKRTRIFLKFKEYYEKLGYRVFTADTDHDLFNRAAARNTLAMVCPTPVLPILDADVFIGEKQLEEAITKAREVETVCRVGFRASNYHTEDVESFSIEDALKESEEITDKAGKQGWGDRVMLNEANDFVQINYPGCVFIQNSLYWLGMDEELNEYGNEDSNYLRCALTILGEPVTLDGPPLVHLTGHTQVMDSWSAKNSVKEFMYVPLGADAIVERLTQKAHYGLYGRFT